MAAGTKAREQSLQSTILWMQQEHATTLKGLHTEIYDLQKRCSDLTFQLAMETTSSSQEDFYREKAEQLESQLRDERQKTKGAEELAEKKQKKLKMLEQQLKAQERKYRDEMKVLAQTLNQLNHELDSKGNTIAYLTSQIHSARRVAHQEVGHDPRPHSGSSEDQRYSPAPPKEIAPLARHRRHRSSRSSLSESHGLLATSVRQRAPSGRKVVNQPDFDVDENVPDPTPFLQRQMESRSDSHIKRTERKPLPPIRLSSNESGSVQIQGAVPTPPPPQQTHSYTFVHKHREGANSSSPEVEVESLAVDQADDLRRAQEFKSTSTDCN